MISVDISTAIFLYLVFSLFVIFVLWIRFEKGKVFEKYPVKHQEVWTCEICAYTYVDSKHEDLAQCPQCKSWNKKESAESRAQE